jgi:DNA repair protein RecO (recombination protein O)
MHAIVLSKKDFREFDQITTLYTRDKGKLELLSRGIKKIVSKQAAYLLPFSFVEAEIVRGQEIDHLIRTQPIELFKNIRRDLKKSLLADYIVKLVDQLVPVGEKDERIFELLISVLNFIERVEIPGDTIVLSFIAKFLQLLGFVPVLDRCVVCGKSLSLPLPEGKLEKIKILTSATPPSLPLERGGKVYFSPSAGGSICERDRLQLKRNEVLLPVTLKDIQDFSLLYNEDWDQMNLLETSQIVKDSLYQFLIYQTERKIPNWLALGVIHR